MKRFAWLVALSLSACASDGPKKVDCVSPETLKTLTMCAGPPSADLAVYNAEAKKAQASGDESYNPVPIGQSQTLGPADAAVTVVMFTDLECPFCSRAHDDVKQLLAENPDVRLVFKHYPLPFHQAALPMAIAAITAGEQQKFWEYVDLAYAGQQGVQPETLKAFATEAGIDVEKFTETFGRQDQLDFIQKDVDLAKQLGVNGTPTFFVNGARIEGFPGRDAVQTVINEQRVLVERMVEAGVDRNDMYWRMVALNYEAKPVEEDMPEAAEEPSEPEVEIAWIPVDSAPVRGAKAEDALVTIVAFSDFECPFCGRAEATMVQIREKYPEVRMVFRQFPLEFHQHAMAAGIASVVAAENGKFWEMHDRLFANQTALTDDDLVAYGKELKISEKTMRDALASDAYKQKVLADYQLGMENGVRGTPAFFINGIKVSGALPLEQFAEIIEPQLELARGLKTESGTKGDALYEAMVQANTVLNAAPAE